MYMMYMTYFYKTRLPVVLYIHCVFFLQSPYVYSMCTQYWPTGNRTAPLIKPNFAIDHKS